MTRGQEIAVLAAAIAILLAGAALGAAYAVVAKATGTPSTSERIMLDLTEERPVAP